MTRTRFLLSNCLAATLLAASYNAPVLAETADLACDASLMRGGIAQLSATHATIHTSVLIDADPSEVWHMLTDFDAMSEWSTGTLQGITGDIQNGGEVVVTFLFGVDDTGKPISNEIPHSLIYEDGVKVGWSDPFPADLGGGHDNHIYEVRACGDKTLFVQSDEIVDNPYAVTFVTQLLSGYQLFNAELKAAVEG